MATTRKGKKKTAKKPIRRSAARQKAVKPAKARKAKNKGPARRSVKQSDIVDETSAESFPASDPPAWTPVRGEKG